MEPLTTIRCSSLPLAFLCGGSVRGDLLIDSANAPADDGTAVHFGLARVVSGMDAQAAHDLMMIEHPACNTGEVTPLFWAGAKMWRQIKDWMPSVQVEGEFVAGGLSGHLDAGSTVAPSGVVLDWKSGRKDHDYKHQVFGYAWLMLHQRPELEQVTVHLAWLRTQEIESYTVTRARADEWYQELQSTVINWAGKYREGPHCEHCPRRASCPAITAMARSAVEMFAPGKVFTLATCTGPELAEFFRRVKLLQGLLKDAESAARLEISGRGEVDDGAGGVIHFVSTAGNREIDPLKAWDVLTGRFSDAEMATIVDIGVGKMEKAIKAKAPKGKGAAAIRELSEALEAAGAVKREPGRQLRDERRKAE
jgi:hypothetical protein